MSFLEILTIITIVSGIICLIGRLRAIDPETNIIVEHAKSFLPIFLIVLLLRAFIVEPFRIPSGSMKPTLLVGDFVIATKYNYGIHLPFVKKELHKMGDINRGDVVIFYHDFVKLNAIKRVIGLPGDTISYKNKIIYINNKPVKQDFIASTKDHNLTIQHYNEHLGEQIHEMWTTPSIIRDDYPYNNIIIPVNSYFVMGDNRDGSNDSRFFGMITRDDILAKARAIAISWDSNKFWFRTNRTATVIK